MGDKAYFNELIEWIKETKPNKHKLAKYKLELCKKYKRREIPTDIEVYLNAETKDVPLIRRYLQTKPSRTGSGVAVVATMTAPFPCPHGSCTYCPGGPKSHFGDVPKSYIGNEPSTMRGIRNEFDPYRIIFNRLEQYIILGQNPDKVDQVVMGGTFPSFPKKYQEDFIYFSFKAYNDFSKLFFDKNGFNIDKFKKFFELPGKVDDPTRVSNIKNKILKIRDKNIRSLKQEQKINEKSAIRCIGLTIETRPDWGVAEHGLEFLRLGATRVELGIQTVYDEILKKVKRGHDIAASKKSIADLRDLGFKLNFHVMPGLPDADGRRISYKKDLEGLKELFKNPDFQPDMLKIYPCMVIAGTELEKDYQKRIFKPIETEEAAELIVDFKKHVPEYCRIMRVQRDIPTKTTIAGVNRTNLRQYVTELAKQKGISCRCIRCREIKNEKITGKPKIITREYEASDGREFFISAEADDRLLGFVRMRFPPRSLHPAITKKSAIIRELHVYGQAVAIGADENKTQHKGFGKQLMAKAEEIAKQNGKDKMVVISGIGVREYYRKLGYILEGPYMVKKI